MRRLSRSALVSVAFTVLASRVAHAQGQALAADARTVLAAVVSSDGRPVVDLDVDDFVVTEGGQARDVLDVHVADYPIAVVLDDRLSSSALLPEARAAARRFIERIGVRPVLLLPLSGADGSTSLEAAREDVLDRVDTLGTATHDAVAPLDVIAAAAGQLASAGAPFSAVVVVAGGPVDASAPVRGELLPRIMASGAAVHVVQALGATGTSGDGDDLLRVIAGQTRGQFTPIYSAVSFQAALDRLADRLAIEMMVQYLAPAGPRAGDVRVGVRKPGARVIGLGVK